MCQIINQTLRTVTYIAILIRFVLLITVMTCYICQSVFIFIYAALISYITLEDKKQPKYLFMTNYAKLTMKIVTFSLF